MSDPNGRLGGYDEAALNWCAGMVDDLRKDAGRSSRRDNGGGKVRYTAECGHSWTDRDFAYTTCPRCGETVGDLTRRPVPSKTSVFSGVAAHLLNVAADAMQAELGNLREALHRAPDGLPEGARPSGGVDILAICLDLHMFRTGSSDGYLCTGMEEQQRHLGILRARLEHWAENDGPWGAFDHAVRNLIRTVLLEYGEPIDLPTDIPVPR